MGRAAVFRAVDLDFVFAYDFVAALRFTVPFWATVFFCATVFLPTAGFFVTTGLFAASASIDQRPIRKQNSDHVPSWITRFFKLSSQEFQRVPQLPTTCVKTPQPPGHRTREVSKMRIVLIAQSSRPHCSGPTKCGKMKFLNRSRLYCVAELYLGDIWRT